MKRFDQADYLNSAEAARLVRVPVAVLRNMMRRGRIPFVHRVLRDGETGYERKDGIPVRLIARADLLGIFPDQPTTAKVVKENFEKFAVDRAPSRVVPRDQVEVGRTRRRLEAYLEAKEAGIPVEDLLPEGDVCTAR